MDLERDVKRPPDRSTAIGNEALGHRRHWVTPCYRIPICPGSLVNNAWRGQFQSLSEVLRGQIALHDSNIFERAIGHQVSEKSHRICKRPFSGLEPNDTRCYRKQVTIARQRLHVLAPRILNALKTGSCLGG